LFEATSAHEPPRARPISFRVAERLRLAQQAAPAAGVPADALDADLAVFRQRYPVADAQERRDLLLQALSPALHWTPAGLAATRIFAGRPM
jgi:hypothetical protein